MRRFDLSASFSDSPKCFAHDALHVRGGGSRGGRRTADFAISPARAPRRDLSLRELRRCAAAGVVSAPSSSRNAAHDSDRRRTRPSLLGREREALGPAFCCTIASQFPCPAAWMLDREHQLQRVAQALLEVRDVPSGNCTEVSTISPAKVPCSVLERGRTLPCVRSRPAKNPQSSSDDQGSSTRRQRSELLHKLLAQVARDELRSPRPPCSTGDDFRRGFFEYRATDRVHEVAFLPTPVVP